MRSTLILLDARAGAGVSPASTLPGAESTSATVPRRWSVVAQCVSIIASSATYASSRSENTPRPSLSRNRAQTLAAITLGDTAFAQVVGGKLHLHPISRHHAHKVQAYFA